MMPFAELIGICREPHGDNQLTTWGSPIPDPAGVSSESRRDFVSVSSWSSTWSLNRSDVCRARLQSSSWRSQPVAIVESDNHFSANLPLSALP
jgi:hypothetical protein